MFFMSFQYIYTYIFVSPLKILMYLFHKRQTKAQRLGLSVNQTKENYQLELVKLLQ